MGIKNENESSDDLIKLKLYYIDYDKKDYFQDEKSFFKNIPNYSDKLLKIDNDEYKLFKIANDEYKKLAISKQEETEELVSKLVIKSIIEILKKKNKYQHEIFYLEYNLKKLMLIKKRINYNDNDIDKLLPEFYILFGFNEKDNNDIKDQLRN